MKKNNLQKPPRPLKANQICQQFDISKATLFRWEREGVISPPPRDWRNWRIYAPENVEQIRKIIGTRHNNRPDY